MIGTKEQAWSYLRGLERALAETGMPRGADMNSAIRSIMASATSDGRQRHLRKPEAAFLNHFVLPTLYAHLKDSHSLTDQQAKTALLNEYHRSMPETSLHSPAYPGRHPFGKVLGSSPATVYAQWLKPGNSDGLTQSCPDFALHDPFPHRIVFEGKYFGTGSLEYAQRQLATDIYQAFFYRGLPRAKARKPQRPNWDYDYSCFLAFDASKEGSLLTAWKALPLKVRNSFWDTGNIYVMILRD